MTAKSKRKPRRVAISFEMDFGFKRHLEAYAGCRAYAEEAGWETFIHPAPDRVLTSGRGDLAFDGILARATPDIAAAARKAKVPLVNIWMNTPVPDLPSVFIDADKAGAMAAEHLLGRGFRQFAYLGHQRDVDSRGQLAGFEAMIKEAGFQCTALKFPRTSVEGPAPGWERFVARLEEWIDTWQAPIGIFVTMDLYCRYIIDVCRAKGLHVSQDVAIVGAGNEPIICDSASPTLTSIDMAFTQIGYQAAALLDRLMSGSKPPAEPILVSPAELIPRQSTDVYAADDPMVARALRFIAEHSHERIEVKEVIAAVATNRRSLERKFSESLGRSIAAEITRLRIERAKRRMVETDAPMKDIALDAGFRNADHFYKVFARVEGIPPTRFRDERQQVFLDDSRLQK